MPIYQYKCTDCGHQFEVLQKMSDPLLRDCPQCSEPGLRKQLTAAAFKLKGSGWYETDFKNSGAKPAAKKTADAGSSDVTAPTNTAESAGNSTPSADSVTKKTATDSAA